MIRSFLIALVTIVGVSLATLPEPLGAQATPAQQPASFPLEFAGGTPGVSIEIFLNAGKVGDTTVNSTGGGNWLLDLGNAGKTRVSIYVDVCQDGKIVKVMFVTGNGQAPPEDERCNRRLAAMSFQSDCGVTRINFDLRNFGARVVGCAAMYTRPQFYLPVVGAGVVAPFLFGGDDGPTVVAAPPPPPTVTVNPPVTAPVNNTAPPTAPVAPVTDFSGSLTGLTTFHPPGASTSFICGVAILAPVIANATWAVTANGPAPLPNQNVTGQFNNNGQASWRFGIGQTGIYTIQLNITANGVTRTFTANHSATAASGNCPSVP